ncbi:MULTISPECIES: carbohydrate ABC transporter permease [Streptomyces]|uniref:Sugar ABC transporter permease n=1 Tax=Streptomyces glycanivorans TaxID=3033808 RepID=A0ABY9J2W6_9ACTN|nr:MULTISPECIES: sugar ABC transporter permease [unclassified Streptomyces]WSQ75689.1 sugar ABC transporter permease [Streptomyces sp. NBC_01213]WLQ62180.1 sugar ABC transporter permease [Streptomyces sp. Alt3]WSQ82933.1 sugar ABC transporter permease [Streptomyces sp. NBC_01212]WSR04609.1 sugar ABC transporter permease [Streptomyces sp. NBC_01208]WSR46267.1 sugar ABC transporter permease [Streptomyces sp. NBC_01201]
MLACLLPALVLFAVFMVYPTVNVFRMSFYTWSGFSPDMTFVGLDNFRHLIDDKQFVRAFQNTVALLVVVTVVTMGMGLFLAAIMTRQKLRGRNFLRFVLYVPNVLSVVVIAAVFSAVYDQNNGLLNGTLRLLSLDGWQQVWLGNQKIVLYSVGIAMVWQSLGYYMVLYMSSMSSIPEELYEAAGLDGASNARQFFSITMPLIWQNLRTSLTFFIMSAVNLSFVLVRAMTGGGPDSSSEVLLSYMYKQAYTNSSYGYGMAIGVVIFVFSFLVSLLVSRATRREPLQF